MLYTLEFTELFTRQFEKLDKAIRRRVYNKIQELKENPYRYKALSGPFKGCFSLRVGNYRVIYMPRKDIKKIFLIDVDLREKVYTRDVSALISGIYGRILPP
jgi:mRNA interferase RelE/StbE